MHQVLKKLLHDHTSLLKLLDVLETQIEQFHAGEEPDYELICELLEYVQSYADQTHHPVEEVMMRRMLEKNLDETALVQRLLDQHQGIYDFYRSFRQSLEAVSQGEIISREEVETQGRQLLALQREHLMIENNQIFPLADHVLTNADWAIVQESYPSKGSDLISKESSERFRTLYHYLANH